jgi:hypothetical protein
MGAWKHVEKWTTRSGEEKKAVTWRYRKAVTMPDGSEVKIPMRRRDGFPAQRARARLP